MITVLVAYDQALVRAGLFALAEGPYDLPPAGTDHAR
jgi:hypothetical protein